MRAICLAVQVSRRFSDSQLSELSDELVRHTQTLIHSLMLALLLLLLVVVVLWWRGLLREQLKTMPLRF